MALAQKKINLEAEFVEAPAPAEADPGEVIPTTIPRMSPFRSPARDMQQSLAERLQEQPVPSRKDTAYGLIVGVLGATWVTGMLIYTTL